MLIKNVQWELFLRRSGLNAYAAQALLGELKASPWTNGPTLGVKSPEYGRGYEYDHGLAAFVKMSAEERLGRFESLLGGSRLLLRASEAIDESWQ